MPYPPRARPAVSAPEKFRGVNNLLHPDQIPPGYVAHAQNYRMRDGNCVPRLGVIKPPYLNYTNAVTDTLIRKAGTLYGVAVFKDPNGIEWTIACANGGVYRCNPHNERFGLSLPTGVRVSGPCVPVQAFNKVWLFRGRYLAPLVINDLATGVEDIVARWSAASTYAAALEVAYGPFLTVTSITSAGGVATVTTPAEHGYITGADITISGAVQAEYNGRYNITVLDIYTFIYNFAGSATTPATGTIKCSNMSAYFRAVGTYLTLTSLTSAATTATATKAAHGFTTGQTVTIAGAVQTEYNGTYVITVTGANTFTYTFAGSGTTPATGTITARNSLVLAAQSPDTNPEAWTQIYNILPNADDALFINNRLLVPTAYTPSAVNDPAAAYNSASSYTKKDFIVATDFLDQLHFDFANEFRINQGSDDEIVTLAKFNQDTVIVFKERSWGILSNIRYDLTSLSLDMRYDGYGACARAALVAGRNVFFPALKRGLVSVAQNELGKVNSVDIPFSNEIDAYVKRINWNYASQQRLAYWNDCLYWTVALDAGEVRRDVIRDTAVYTPIPAPGVFGSYTVTLTPGVTYHYETGANELTAVVNTPTGQVELTTLGRGTFIAGGSAFTSYSPASASSGAVTLRVWSVLSAVNNAILVYDFRTQAWAGVDTGEAVTVKDFFLPTYNGLQRLAYTANDGWVNIYEEAISGDQIESGTAPGLTWIEIATDVLSRGITSEPGAYGRNAETDNPKQFKRLNAVLSVWNAKFTITANTGAAFQEQVIREEVEFSRTKYLKPFDKAAYVDGNANGDHGTRGRGNYSVPLNAGGVYLGDGLIVSQEQEVTVRASVRSLAHRFLQSRITNNQGRCTVQAIGIESTEGMRRDNVIV